MEKLLALILIPGRLPAIAAFSPDSAAVPRGEILSGAAPKDGTPAIDIKVNPAGEAAPVRVESRRPLPPIFACRLARRPFQPETTVYRRGDQVCPESGRRKVFAG